MTKQQFLEYCLNTYGTSPDYPFDEDFETAVLRHADNRKWYAIVMRVSRRKFGFDSEAISLGEAKFHSPQANFVEKSTCFRKYFFLAQAEGFALDFCKAFPFPSLLCFAKIFGHRSKNAPPDPFFLCVRIPLYAAQKNRGEFFARCS